MKVHWDNYLHRGVYPPRSAKTFRDNQFYKA